MDVSLGLSSLDVFYAYPHKDLHFVVGRRAQLPNNPEIPESNVGGSLATDRATHAGKVSTDRDEA